MDKNYCPNCSTENEVEYIYCKNCGTQLKFDKEPASTENKQYSQTAPEQQPDFKNKSYSQSNGYDGIDFNGITADEMTDYIGKNSNNILPKFAKMQITMSKISWCWPVAILSILLGPLGAAIWFFHRKMYKHATILTVIGALITIIVSIFSPSYSEEVIEALENALIASDIESVISIFSNIPTSEVIITYVVSLVEDIANLLTCIICGIYGYHWYKEHCISKIYEYRQLQTDARYYRFGLTSVGGTSGGMLALGIILYCTINTVASAIASIVNIII